jgi:uncharacterized protein (TIGR03085 family)
MTWARHERAALAEAVAVAGPDAPTLCEGWTARDLLAHVVVRERRPDSGPGLLVPALAGWTEHVRRRAAERPFDDLLRGLREGPPWYSLLALPGADEAANLAEFFVHTEDVRRGAGTVPPRELPAGLRDRIWQLLSRQARFAFRRCPPLELVRTDDGAAPAATVAAVRAGSASVPAAGPEPLRLRGPAPELLLHAFNRTTASLVEIEGDAASVAQLGRIRLGL